MTLLFFAHIHFYEPCFGLIMIVLKHNEVSSMITNLGKNGQSIYMNI